MKNKRGDVLHEAVIFIVLNLIFFGILFMAVSKVSSGTGLHEQVYAKQIALLIDSAKPGTIISINAEEFTKFIEEKEISENEIISFSKNKVNVKLSRKSSGYNFEFFSTYKIEHSFSRENNKLFLNILIKEND